MRGIVDRGFPVKNGLMAARIAIAGGGPSGLMMGRLLAEDGHHVDLFEAQKKIGGLCRSRKVEGYTYDLAGGHIMYTKDERVAALWEKLFADEPLEVHDRQTAILHDKDHFVSYPFENALGELPLEENLECTESTIEAWLERQRGAPQPDNFLDWMRWKMGSGVCRLFMEPYNRKVWKADLAEMGTSWIADRIPEAPIEDILRASLGETTEGYTHQSVFRYPAQGGFGSIHEKIANSISDRIHTDHRVQQIEQANGGEGWVVDGESYDIVISTLPLHHLPAILQGMEKAPAEAAGSLQHRGLATMLFGIEEDWVQPYSWLYLPRPEQGPANRITYLSNYAHSNAPEGKGSILAEITYADEIPDITENGRREVARALQNAGLLDADRLTITDAYTTPLAYILYDQGFEERRQTVLDYLDGLTDFYALGRFGRYEYHNSDQCLSQAMDLYEHLKAKLDNTGETLP